MFIINSSEHLKSTEMDECRQPANHTSIGFLPTIAFLSFNSSPRLPYFVIEVDVLQKFLDYSILRLRPSFGPTRSRMTSPDLDRVPRARNGYVGFLCLPLAIVIFLYKVLPCDPLFGSY